MNRISQTLGWILCALVLLAASGVCASASATTFAVLLQGCGAVGNEECDNWGDRVTVENPLFEPQGGSGENPLFEANSISFNPLQFADGRDVGLVVSFAESLPRDLPSPPGGGYPFAITLRDLASGQFITQFDPPIDIILGLPRYESRNPSPGLHRDMALSYYDETSGEWSLVDRGLETCDTGKYCGKTNHFTIFSVGAIPEPSSLALSLLAAGLVASLARRRKR